MGQPHTPAAPAASQPSDDSSSGSDTAPRTPPQDAASRRRVTFVTVPLEPKAVEAAPAPHGPQPDEDEASAARADALLALGAPLSRQPAPRRDPLAPFADLLRHPAQKWKVAELSSGDRLVAAHGPALAEASYLMPMQQPGRAFRLGKTTIKGSYSKIRDFVDERGQTGKMRVLHLTPQRSEEPRQPVMAVLPDEYRLEVAALRKAGSPVAYERAYSVVDEDERGHSVKLYVPLRDLGVDTFYLCDNDAALRADTRPAAAALRAYLAGVNQALLRLHRNEAQASGMVHRDIKPENVLFDARGNVNLIDFGLATKARLLRQAPFSGTSGYIAPEYIATLEPRRNVTLWPVSAKIDLWSLATGALLVFFTDATYGLPQQQISRNGAFGDPNDHINLGLLQEAWQLAREGVVLSSAQARELERSKPRGLSATSHEQFRASFFDRLDTLQAAIDRVDPAMGKWLLRRLYRADPVERFDSAELQQALDALPPLYASHEQDRAAARDLYAELFPQAQQAMVQEAQAAGRPAAPSGPTLAQLRRLPALPEG